MGESRIFDVIYARESGGAANSSLTLDLEWVQLASSPMECKKVSQRVLPEED